MSLFGSMNAAIPFLLDLVRVPSATFQLFLATGVLNSRFGTLAAAMHMVVLALAGTYALTGQLRFSPARILRYVLVTRRGDRGDAGGRRAPAAGDGRRDLRPGSGGPGHAIPPSAVAEGRRAARAADGAAAARRRGHGRAAGRCRSAGVLRVGYIDGGMPYSFLNGRGELVGFDVEMAHMLAAELGVALEFAPVPRDRLAEALDAGLCDVIMGGVFLTTRRGAQMVYSSNYIDETLAFVVPDHRRADFSSAEWIRGTTGLKVAVPDLPYLTGPRAS